FWVRAGFALMLAAVLIHIRADDPLTRTVGFCIANLSTLWFCQIARAHYFVIWMPTLLFAGVRLLRQKRPRAAVGLTVAPACLVLSHYVFLDQAGRIGLLGLGTAVWLFVISLFLFSSRNGLDSRNNQNVF